MGPSFSFETKRLAADSASLGPGNQSSWPLPDRVAPAAMDSGVGLVDQRLATGLDRELQVCRRFPPDAERRTCPVYRTPYASNGPLIAAQNSFDSRLNRRQVLLRPFEIPLHCDHIVLPYYGCAAKLNTGRHCRRDRYHILWISVCASFVVGS